MNISGTPAPRTGENHQTIHIQYIYMNISGTPAPRTRVLVLIMIFAGPRL